MVPNGDNDARTEGEKCSQRPCSDGPVARTTEDPDSDPVAGHVRHKDVGDVQEEMRIDEPGDACERSGLGEWPGGVMSGFGCHYTQRCWPTYITLIEVNQRCPNA